MATLVCENCHNRNVSYFDTSLRFQISQCGHQFCSTCITRMFTSALVVPCPVCRTLINRASLSSKTKSQLQHEKLLRSRQRIMAWYNKTRQDFPSLGRYNDYLERREHIIHNLAFGVDEAATLAEVERYRQKHRDLIERNISKRAKDERESAEREREAREAAHRRQQRSLVDQKQRKRMRRAARRQRLDRAMGMGSGEEDPVARSAQGERSGRDLLASGLAAPAGLGVRALAASAAAGGLPLFGPQPGPVMGGQSAQRKSSAGGHGARARRAKARRRLAGGWDVAHVEQRAWEDVVGGLLGERGDGS
jgi:hypothetical protein